MEEKLFWVGILVGLHLLLSEDFKKKNKFEDSKFSLFWHRTFLAIFAFSFGLLLAVVFDNRNGEIVTAQLFTFKQVIIGLVASMLGWIYVDLPFAKFNREKKDKEPPEYIKKDLEWSETLFSAVIMASIVMYIFLQAFKIPSGSMRVTFLEGDHLFVNKLIYGVRIPFTEKKLLKLRDIERRDIVIFRFPSEDPDEFQCGGRQYGKDFIKRVIGLPGDTVEIKDGVVIVNGQRQEDENYAQFTDSMRYPKASGRIPIETFQKYWENRETGKLFSEYIRDNFGPVTVPQKNYFVMGDNRDRSCDSRYWGPVPEINIKGKPLVIYWPPNRIGLPK